MGITCRGRETYSIKITLGREPVTGKRLYYTETFKGKEKDARLREAELKIQKRAKRLVLSSAITFRECFSLYSDDVRSRLSLTCFATYEDFIKRYLFPTIGDKKLKNLEKDDFQKVYNFMGARGLSPCTIHTLHRAVRVVILWAVNKGLLSEDIIESITLPKIPKAQPEFLTYKETQAFFDVAPEYWYGNALKFQFMTGLRNQELMALMWSDINFETGEVCISRACIWVRGFKGFKCTKTGESRVIELDSPTLDFLKRVKTAQEEHIQSRKSCGLAYGDERLVFCTRGGLTPHPGAVRDPLRRILKRIGITRRFRWYGIRHTHATHLLDTKGASPKMIADRMGHSVQMLFSRYGHQMQGQQRNALSQISSHVTL
jgi:integrase